MHIRADLHVHTRASDGDSSPDEIARLAGYSGLDVVAITDHDTISGVKEAMSSTTATGVHVIPGVEISIAYDPGTLHILGYFPSYPHAFEKILEPLQKARTARLPRIIERLKGLGIEISISEVEDVARDGQIGRPHIAKVLVNKGYVADFDEAFTRFLAKGKPAYVEKHRMSSIEAIESIIGHGGLPVLAHPFTLKLAEDKLEGFIGDLVEQGLKGIEIFYPDHTRAQKKFYSDLARKFHLAATGGTDFHGASLRGMALGKFGLDAERLEEFLKRLLRRQES